MSFNSLLIDHCDVVHREHDKWGKVSVTSIDLGVVCRWEYKNRLMRNFRGEEVMSYAQVFFKPTANVGQNDQLRHDGREWSPVRIERQEDSVGLHHLEVYVY
jgi:hypothetical protein